MKILASLFKNRIQIALILCVILDVLILIVFALTQSVDILTYHGDGTYQTASVLYRLAEGQIPGRDFFPYLGVGVNYFLYPWFAIAGENVAASLFATNFIVPLCSVLSVGFLSWLITKNRTLSVINATLFLVAVLFVLPNPPRFLIERFTPGNSLRPLRGSIPYISAAIVYSAIKLKIRPHLVYGIVGFSTGISFLWANDFGISSAFFLTVTTFAYSVFSRQLSLKVLGSFLAGLLLALGILTKGYLLPIIQYNFRDVRLDQYWYFGPWNAENRIFDLTELPARFFEITGYWFLVLPILFGLTFFRPSLERVALVYLGSTLVFGGTIAIYGGQFNPGYLASFVFWCKAVTAIATIFLIVGIGQFLLSSQRFRFVSQRLQLSKFLQSAVVLIIPIYLFSLLLDIQEDYTNYKETADGDSARFYVEELGGYLPIDWADHVKMARNNSNASFIEEYWGLWGAITGKHSDIPVDSVIHALGKTRDRFSKTLYQLPEVIVTSNYLTYVEWHPWNLSANYWFYKPVLEHYTPTQTSPTTIVWRKRSSPQASNQLSGNSVPIKCAVNNGSNPSFVLPDAVPGFYEITLDYQIEADSSRTLVMVRNNINYAVSAHGHLSLNPQGTQIQFPVAIPLEPVREFGFQVLGPADSATTISLKGCSAKPINLDADQVLPNDFVNGSRYAYPINRLPWINGFHQRSAMFMIPLTLANQQQFQVGRELRFVDGKVRDITKIEPTNLYLKVAIKSKPLDGNVFGYPNEFEFVK